MALDAVSNFTNVTVSTTYGSGDTSIVLSSGQGALLPAVPFNVVWYCSSLYSNPASDPNVEIVRVTNIATDTLTVTRAQEGTSASTKNSAGQTYKMLLSPTAKTITDIGTQMEYVANKDTTTTLGTSDTKYPSQKAVKAYVDGKSRPLGVMTASFSTSTGSETDLIANTNLPGGSLTTGRAIKFEGYMGNTNTYNSVNIGIYYGGTKVATLTWSGTNPAYTVGYFSLTIAYVGASSQYISGMNGAGAGYVSTTSSINSANDNNVKMTIQSGVFSPVTIYGATISLI